MNVKTNKFGWLGSLASLLASAAALVCPACIPAVASLLASLGIGLAASEQVIRPLLIGLLALAVGSFVWSARRHGQWWIVGAGVIGGVLVYLGRYFGFAALWMNQAALWSGAGALIGTSLVNLVLKRGCTRCATDANSANASEGCCSGKVKP